MADLNTVGTWLRRERELRGITLKHIAGQTKVSIGLLEALEADDLSRWPGGIFRRAFVKSYAQQVGLDPDAVMRRIDAQHPLPDSPAGEGVAPAAVGHGAVVVPIARAAAAATVPTSRVRLTAILADLTVAIAIGLGFAASGSRLLWPVLVIAAYHAAGVYLFGTSPMVGLLSDQIPAPAPVAAGPRTPARRLERRRPATAPTMATRAADDRAALRA